MDITLPRLAGDPEMLVLFGGTLALLMLGTMIGRLLRYKVKTNGARATIDNLNARIRAWWMMTGVFTLTLLFGRTATTVLFALLSMLALREFISLTPTARSDHRALLWSFYTLIPLQYYLIGTGRTALAITLIPVSALVLIPIRSALAGETERFLERTSEICCGLLICVYLPSFAPALLTLTIPGYAGQDAKLLLFFVIVVELSDVLQYVWGKLAGRRAIAPQVSPHKTWEGFVGGILSASLAGALLWRATPFPFGAAAGMSLAITLLGFSGGLVMSAIKRDRGVKDYGALIGGHGGMLDRIDSLCFAAPAFFHLTRYFYT